MGDLKGTVLTIIGWAVSEKSLKYGMSLYVEHELKNTKKNKAIIPEANPFLIVIN